MTNLRIASARPGSSGWLRRHSSTACSHSDGANISKRFILTGAYVTSVDMVSNPSVGYVTYGDRVMAGRRKSLREKFEGKVAVGGENECWRWLGHTKKGYGVINCSIAPKHRLAHRVAYELAHNVELQPEQKVLHACDNPACCNPNHLRIGTQTDNMNDRASRGRWKGKSKLSPEQVIDIRRSVESAQQLSRRYSVVTRTIYAIRKRRSWKHVF